MINLEELIQTLRTKVNIVNVIQQYIKLETKDNLYYYGVCPSCNNLLIVNKDKQMYFCFNCKSAGDVFLFLMNYNKWNYLQTIEYLLKETKSKYTMDDVYKSFEVDEYKSILDKMNLEAAKFFYIILRNSMGKEGMKYYTTNRKLSKETMYKFGLGFAPYGKNLLYKHLKNKGFTDDDLSKSGLVTYNEDGSVVDKFRHRVIVPIMDVNGKVIAFGGRLLGDGKPKYINSQETAVFDKGKTLFALNYAKDSKREGFILCEGYMDVISMHQAGFDNAIASLGTALTEKHAQLIKQYRDKVYLAYDSDGPGCEAAMRAIPILRSVGIEPKIINMLPYKDPDEFIKELGIDAYAERIEKALDANSFIIEHYKELLSKLDNSEADDMERKSLMKKIAFVLSDDM